MAFPISPEDEEPQNNVNSLIVKIQEANLKLDHLESVRKKTIQELNSKSALIMQNEKKIQELNQQIRRLQTTLANFEDNTLSTNKDSHALEEQVQLLWEALRQNNFNIYNLELKARNADERLNSLKMQVEEMADIVSEQWIQIQQHEQALQIAQRRASKIKQHLRAPKCSFMKSIKSLLQEHLEMVKVILDPYVSNGGHALKSCISEASDHLKRTYTAAKYYHHQLQDYMKQTVMRKNLTAVLAHEEVVFFMVSALIVFSVLSIYLLLSECFT